MIAPQKRLFHYRTCSGKAPFEEWLNDLRDQEVLVVLLLGGDKGAQERDIKKAIEYWEDYKIRK